MRLTTKKSEYEVCIISTENNILLTALMLRINYPWKLFEYVLLRVVSTFFYIACSIHSLSRSTPRRGGHCHKQKNEQPVYRDRVVQFNYMQIFSQGFLLSVNATVPYIFVH